MKQNTFEPCKDHENGHFGWCLLCEIEQLRREVNILSGRLNYLLDNEGPLDGNHPLKCLVETMKIIESGSLGPYKNIPDS